MRDRCLRFVILARIFVNMERYVLFFWRKGSIKLRFLLAVVFVCLAAATVKAIDIGGHMVATLDIANEDQIPHSVTIDENNRTIRIFVAGGGSTNLVPGQDVALRVYHGTWRVFGDSGREMQVRFHRGQDYKLYLSPYVHGDVRTLTGVLDDGYNHYRIPLADMRGRPHLDDYPHHEYDPSFHGDYSGDDGYQYYRTDSQESLGHAIHEAFDNFLHDISNQNEAQPQYAPQPGYQW